MLKVKQNGHATGQMTLAYMHPIGSFGFRYLDFVVHTSGRVSHDTYRDLLLIVSGDVPAAAVAGPFPLMGCLSLLTNNKVVRSHGDR